MKNTNEIQKLQQEKIYATDTMILPQMKTNLWQIGMYLKLQSAKLQKKLEGGLYNINFISKWSFIQKTKVFLKRPNRYLQDYHNLTLKLFIKSNLRIKAKIFSNYLVKIKANIRELECKKLQSSLQLIICKVFKLRNEQKCPNIYLMSSG
ncbi:hypothetical protein IMG5_164030 [Ichthyophthirius multifiliis]|uniref:Uncharacterized protein n=1 Tax=Ichthyophthirius multifiliis TaxID=5932 RepID=G0R0E9_ICHMU|nr:hypothetical protein IMG5_164030 [Ichthyophthirius multifiliis]EGR29058.1 hypothetical protein IMG5_164030 [Ichthyophthirius multifiliis]|eukprot:XP_004030294.1 hypothetical protein IMG5_164030 [Ichthyophthirius multifiliis]